MFEYAQELIRALIVMVWALVSSFAPGSLRFITDANDQCGTTSQAKINILHNYVVNPSFETDGNGDKTPDDWRRANLQPLDTTDCQSGHSGTCSFHFGTYTAKPSEYVRRLEQIIPLKGSRGTQITVSGWSKANNVAKTLPPSFIAYGIGVGLFDEHDEYILLPEGEGFAYFRTGSHDFEKTQTTFTASEDFLCMKVGAFFSEGGEAWFDDIEVTVVPPVTLLPLQTANA